MQQRRALQAVTVALSIIVTSCLLQSGVCAAEPSQTDSSSSQQCAMAEAHKTAGNDAFRAGDFPTAVKDYSEAVEADGNVAKYLTNLSNALLKCGRVALAIEVADAAIAVDRNWPKGFYFKALALQELPDYARAVAACEEGLTIHRDNAALTGLCSRVKEFLQQQLEQQQQCPAAGSGMRTVVYRARVRDATGQEQSFRFEHRIDGKRLARAAHDQAVANQVMREVTSPHHDEMLQAKPELCVSCQLQHGKQQRATKLYLHAMSYLHKPQPFVEDMGPTPTCSSPACGAYATQMAQQIMAEIQEELEQEAA